MPPKSRVPIKGEPNFTNVSDKRLDGFLDFAQEMIFAYKNVSPEKTKVLKEIWKDISKEHTDRICSVTIKALEEEDKSESMTCRKIKVAKPVKLLKR